MTELDQRLRDHYQSLQLDAGAIQAMKDAAQQSSTQPPVRSSYLRNSAIRGVAALLIVTLTLGIHQYGTHTERTSRTLKEAAMNHSTRLQLEFTADNILAIDRQMTQLPFEVVLPQSLKEHHSLIGARYCTINGELAAHVKLVDDRTHKQVSLFMTSAVDELRTIDQTRDQIDGINVTLWNESGLFYALASRSTLY